MSQEKTTLEVIAPTVDDAVQKGLAQLNLPQDAVDVEVLDAGSRGLFGLGSRQARIRLTIKSASEAVQVARPARMPEVETPRAEPASAARPSRTEETFAAESELEGEEPLGDLTEDQVDTL